MWAAHTAAALPRPRGTAANTATGAAAAMTALNGRGASTRRRSRQNTTAAGT
jgi:hypothetical protein